jgi:hypothetical protein
MNAQTVFLREASDRGRTVHLPCVEVTGQLFTVTGRMLKIARLEDEWYQDVMEPAAAIDALRRLREIEVDMVSFWQRLPDTPARYPYHREVESIAALPIAGYDHWWQKQVNGKARNLIRKAEKSGLIVRQIAFTDDFVRGMVEIFNESPVRQGRPFWHYGKSVEAVRREFSRYLYREQLYGAYLGDELAGFIMLADAGPYALLTQIISKTKHRDKSPNNALIAQAVRATASMGKPHLVYANWTPGPLADFKRHNGFQRVDLPRYYVPLTVKGRLALESGWHRGWKEAMPQWLQGPLKEVKRRWHTARA